MGLINTFQAPQGFGSELQARGLKPDSEEALRAAFLRIRELNLDMVWSSPSCLLRASKSDI